ncbi:MAG: hypothetical protein R3C28_01125 [Pirellulaceae bacterium]
MQINQLSSTDQLLGYTLNERIGAGGYGEVWRAEAPGGLAKAVKIIYGCFDDNRAQRELNAAESHQRNPPSVSVVAGTNRRCGPTLGDSYRIG